MSKTGVLMVIAVGIVLGAVDPASAHVNGTTGNDVVVYGWVYHYAAPEGGGWVPRYDGRGGCVFSYAGGNSPTYRGAYQYRNYVDDSGEWDAYGNLGADYLYTPNLYDSDWLVCEYLVGDLANVAVETPTVYEQIVVYGDTTSISSGSGDHVWASVGSTHIFGGGGDDDLVGSPYGDTIEGDYGDDTIYGGSGSDTLYGWEDDDAIVGEYGNDTIAGGIGSDPVLYGGPDNDTIYGDNTDGTGDAGTNDDCDGGGGSDTCGYSSPYNCEAVTSC